MTLPRDTVRRRRWLGALALGTAALMVGLGQTVLAKRLSPGLFVGYWLLCMVLTCVAILVAFADVRALQQRSRQEQRELLEATLKNIESAAKTKSKSNG
jgi:membrane protein implicated in regulation of membrane protease activity